MNGGESVEVTEMGTDDQVRKDLETLGSEETGIAARAVVLNL